MINFRNKRFMLWGILIVIFLVVFIWDYKTPYMHDDFVYSNNTFSQIFTNSINDYNNLNGRFFGQLFTRAILADGQLYSSLIIAMFFTIFMYFLGKVTNIIKRNNVYVLKFILLISTFLLFIPDFGSVVLWRSGAGNYLVVTTVIVIYLYLFTHLDHVNIILVIFTTILAFIAGFGNQNTSGGLILITSLLLVMERIRKEKINPIKFVYLFSSMIGFIVLLSSPGDKKRMRMYDTDWLGYSFQYKLLQGTSKLIEFIHSDPLNYIFLSLIIILMIYSYYMWRKQVDWYGGIIFIISGIITGLVMCLSPEGIDVGRTYFGAFTFLIIGIFYLIPNNLNRIFYVMLTSLMVFSCIYNLLYGVSESMKFNSQLNERYSILEHSKKNQVIKLPPIQYEKNRYTLSGSYVELTPDKDAFPNYDYKWTFNQYVVLKTTNARED